MDKLLVALVSCCLLLDANSIQSAAYIQKCSIKDTNFNNCALNSTRQALPHIIKGDGEHLIPILDPLFVNELKMNDGKINIGFSNMLIRGLKDLELESIRFDFQNKNITVEGRLPALNFTADYEVSGKLIGRSIDGQGPFHTSFFDTSMKYSTTFTLYQHDNGQQYLVLTDYHLDLVPANVTVHMGNLFSGNKVLGDEMNKHINENLGKVLRDTGPQSFETLGLVLHKIFSHAATTVPYNYIFNDTE